MSTLPAVVGGAGVHGESEPISKLESLLRDIVSEFRRFYDAHIGHANRPSTRRATVRRVRDHLPRLHVALRDALGRAGIDDALTRGAGGWEASQPAPPIPPGIQMPAWLAELFSIVEVALRPSHSPRLVYTQSSQLYQCVRQALESSSRFPARDDYPWPAATITGRTARGSVELNPIEERGGIISLESSREQTWELAVGITDHTADVLDCLSILWLRGSHGINDQVAVTPDEILKLRGLTPRSGGQGRRGGYSRKQVQRVWDELRRIDQLWLRVTLAAPKGSPPEIKSRAFIITATTQTTAMILPGPALAHFLAGERKEIALISTAVLQYDPYRQFVEKRIGRYLSWIWRTRRKSIAEGRGDRPFRKHTILDVAGLDLSSHRDGARLAAALDTLARDGVIGSWSELGGPDGEPRIQISPPVEIVGAYASARSPVHQIPESVASTVALSGSPSAQGACDLSAAIRKRRKALALTQAQAAATAGLSQAEWSRAESGDISKLTDQKLRAWLGEIPTLPITGHDPPPE